MCVRSVKSERFHCHHAEALEPATEPRGHIRPRLLHPLQTALVKVHFISMTMLKRRCRKLRLVRRRRPDLCDVKWFVTDRSETQRSNLGANHSLIAETAARYRHLSNLLTWTLCFSKTHQCTNARDHLVRLTKWHHGEGADCTPRRGVSKVLGLTAASSQ